MGLRYTIRLVDLAKGEQFEEAFTVLSPNRRMPAIVDPTGPDGQPISIFESGAILQYLARKTGKFYGETERQRIAVDEWLMWQMGGLGPMAGQALGQTHGRNKNSTDAWPKPDIHPLPNASPITVAITKNTNGV